MTSPLASIVNKSAPKFGDSYWRIGLADAARRGGFRNRSISREQLREHMPVGRDAAVERAVINDLLGQVPGRRVDMRRFIPALRNRMPRVKVEIRRPEYNNYFGGANMESVMDANYSPRNFSLAPVGGHHHGLMGHVRREQYPSSIRTANFQSVAGQRKASVGGFAGVGGAALMRDWPRHMLRNELDNAARQKFARFGIATSDTMARAQWGRPKDLDDDNDGIGYDLLDDHPEFQYVLDDLAIPGSQLRLDVSLTGYDPLQGDYLVVNRPVDDSDWSVIGEDYVVEPQMLAHYLQQDASIDWEPESSDGRMPGRYAVHAAAHTLDLSPIIGDEFARMLKEPGKYPHARRLAEIMDARRRAPRWNTPDDARAHMKFNPSYQDYTPADVEEEVRMAFDRGVLNLQESSFSRFNLSSDNDYEQSRLWEKVMDDLAAAANATDPNIVNEVGGEDLAFVPGAMWYDPRDVTSAPGREAVESVMSEWEGLVDMPVPDGAHLNRGSTRLRSFYDNFMPRVARDIGGVVEPSNDGRWNYVALEPWRERREAENWRAGPEPVRKSFLNDIMARLEEYDEPRL